MLKAFHSNRPIVLLLLPFIVVAIFIINYFTNYHQAGQEMGFGMWGKIQDSKFNLYFSIGAMFLVSLGAILINQVYNKNTFSEKSNFLPGILYVVFLSYFHSFYYLDGLALCQFILILFFSQVIRLDQKEDGRKIVFNTAFFFGLACTFFPVLLLGTPVLFFMIWVNRPFIFRESMIAVTGLATPLIYAVVYSYVFEVNIGLDDLNSSSIEVKAIDTWVIIFSFFLFFIFSLKRLLNKFQISSIKLKKIFRLLLLLTILLFVLFLIDALTYQKVQVLSLMITSLVLVFPYAFDEKKTVLAPTILFYLVFVFAVSKFFISFNDLAL